jgi:ferrochelatase
MAHGAPQTLSDVASFLTSVRGGRALLPQAVDAYRARYERIGGTSPLAATTRSVAVALGRALREPVYLGTRHGSPSIAEALDRAAADGVQHLTAIALTPYAGPYAAGAYRAALDQVLADRAAEPTVDFVRSWHQAPALIQGWVRSTAAALNRFRRAVRDRVHVVFSAHSVPVAPEEEEDPYPRQVTDTASRVAHALHLADDRWQVAYQSAPRRTGRPWLEPDLADVVAGLPARSDPNSVPQALVVPIGFVIDNLETLYDLDVELTETAASLGVRLERAPALNDSPALIAALARAVRGEA